MDSTAKPGKARNWVFYGLCLLLLIQGIARFAVQPAVGFVLDDWAFESHAQSLGSVRSVVLDGLMNPTRPLSLAVQQVQYLLYGERIVPYWWASVISYSLALALFFALVLELTGKPWIAFVAGLIFAVLPNVCGHFHWLCYAVGPVQLVYLPSAWLMARHARRGERWTWWGSLFWYATGLGFYEVGVFLPLAYAVLLWDRGWRKAFRSLLPFAAVLAVYAAWRFTAGFGLGRHIGVAPQFTPGTSWWTLKHTAARLVSWWTGQDWWRAVGDGATGFSELPRRLAAVLLSANALLMFLAGCWLWKTDVSPLSPEEPPDMGNRFGTLRLVLFCWFWIGATCLPVFLGYFAARLNYLPGAGIAFLVALVLERIRPDRWLPLMLATAFAGMVVAEGDTKNWADSIRFQRNLYASMADCRADWEKAEVLWLDTRNLSQRLTPGILADNCHHIDTIVEYRNAGFLRSFGPSSMANLILEGKPGPQVVLDVEYGAHEDNGILKWHERYNPDKPFETPMERVYRLDVFAAGTRSVADGTD